MTSGKIDGGLFLLYVDGTAVAHSTSCSYEITSDTRETTTKDSGAFAEFEYTKISGTASVEGLVSMDATNYKPSQLRTAQLARTKVDIIISTDVEGDEYISASAIVTSVSEDHPDKDNATFSASFQFTGTISELTVT